MTSPAAIGGTRARPVTRLSGSVAGLKAARSMKAPILPIHELEARDLSSRDPPDSTGGIVRKRPRTDVRLPVGPRAAWVIIGGLVSLPGRRFLATLAGFWLIGTAALNAVADAPTDSTWIPITPLPHQGRSAAFALAVDPNNNQVLVAANSDGTLFRSPNAGTTWVGVHTGKAPVLTIAFSPNASGLVLAGTRESGALVSRDGGATWAAAAGLEGRAVRVFAFALGLVAAGTDRGVYVSKDGVTWSASGLANHGINALAVEAIHAPVRLVAGGDAQAAGGILPLYQSVDVGVTWA